MTSFCCDAPVSHGGTFTVICGIPHGICSRCGITAGFGDRSKPPARPLAQPPIMDEQDEIDTLKATIKAKSEAILRLKREAAALLNRADEAYSGYTEWMMQREREALRKALSEIN